MNPCSFRTSAFLRRLLGVDAATCIATGLLPLPGSGLLVPLLRAPTVVST